MLTQFTDDATFTLQGSRQYLEATSALMDLFGMVSGLHINRAKCSLYWFGTEPPPHWTHTFGCQVVTDNSVTRFLGTPFGLSPAVQDFDHFLITKVTRKLRYWTSTHLSLAARAVVVNSILLSTLWYFLNIWGGSKDILHTIRGKLRNYLWAGTEENSRVRVRWDDCCASKAAGGLGLIDPEDALTALLSKWIVKGVEHGSSPLHILLHHRLGQIQPMSASTWPQNLQWPLLSKFSSPRSSGVWTRVIQAGRLCVRWLKLHYPRTSMKCSVQISGGRTTSSGTILAQQWCAPVPSSGEAFLISPTSVTLNLRHCYHGLIFVGNSDFLR